MPVGRVNRKFRTVAARLQETMIAHRGIGIAAPQIGEPWRICIVLRDWKPGLVPVPMFDPVIIGWSEKRFVVDEGCLSFPGEAIPVERYAEVTVHHMTGAGTKVQTIFRGIEAACAQHEIDHLNGITFHMRGLTT